MTSTVAVSPTAIVPRAQDTLTELVAVQEPPWLGWAETKVRPGPRRSVNDDVRRETGPRFVTVEM